MRPAVVIALCVAVSAPARAEPAPREVRGVVTRAGSPTPVAGAAVLTERGAIAVTDIDGYFAILVEPGARELTITANGFAPRTIAMRDGVLRVELVEAKGAELIEVTGKAPEQTKPLSYALTVDEVRAIPGAANDILRAAQVLPGVARIPYSFGGLVLRGASPRDSAVYLDGIEVPIAFHFGGVTSFYPSGMLAELAIISGGHDASHGRAQGGVVTLATREPRTDGYRVGGSIGLFDSSVHAEGPLAKGGFLIGVRRSYFDAVAAPFVADDVPLPSYLDVQIRTGWGDAKRRGRITPMVFASMDRVANDEVSLTSLFVRAAVPYLRQWGRTTLRVVPWIGTNRLTFHEEADPEFEDVEQSFSRPMYPGGVRAELLRDFAWGHLRGGAELESGYLAKSQFGGEDDDGPFSVDGETTMMWSDAALWAEARWKIDGERIAVKPGVRVEAYGLSGELVVDPRLNIHQKLSDGVTLRQAIGRYHQPPTPTDVDPSRGNPKLDSSYTDQISLGIDAELPASIVSSVTGFYHDGKRIAVRATPPGEPMDPDDRELNLGGLGPTFLLLLEKQLGFVEYREHTGRARSYGVEVSLKRNVGRWFSLLSYTLAKSERTDDPRMGVGWRPFELDQRHNLQIASSVRLSKWQLGARLQLVSGNPYTPITLEERGDEYVEIEHPWEGRLPMFFSIDLRADRRWRRPWGDVVLYIDVQNATFHSNVEGREADFDFENNRSIENDIPGLPIIPFFGVEFHPKI